MSAEQEELKKEFLRQRDLHIRKERAKHNINYYAQEIDRGRLEINRLLAEKEIAIVKGDENKQKEIERELANCSQAVHKREGALPGMVEEMKSTGEKYIASKKPKQKGVKLPSEYESMLVKEEEELAMAIATSIKTTADCHQKILEMDEEFGARDAALDQLISANLEAKELYRKKVEGAEKDRVAKERMAQEAAKAEEKLEEEAARIAKEKEAAEKLKEAAVKGREAQEKVFEDEEKAIDKALEDAQAAYDAAEAAVDEANTRKINVETAKNARAAYKASKGKSKDEASADAGDTTDVGDTDVSDTDGAPAPDAKSTTSTKSAGGGLLRKLKGKKGDPALDKAYKGFYKLLSKEDKKVFDTKDMTQITTLSEEVEADFKAKSADLTSAKNALDKAKEDHASAKNDLSARIDEFNARCKDEDAEAAKLEEEKKAEEARIAEAKRLAEEAKRLAEEEAENARAEAKRIEDEKAAKIEAKEKEVAAKEKEIELKSKESKLSILEAQWENDKARASEDIKNSQLFKDAHMPQDLAAQLKDLKKAIEDVGREFMEARDAVAAEAGRDAVIKATESLRGKEGVFADKYFAHAIKGEMKITKEAWGAEKPKDPEEIKARFDELTSKYKETNDHAVIQNALEYVTQALVSYDSIDNAAVAQEWFENKLAVRLTLQDSDLRYLPAVTKNAVGEVLWGNLFSAFKTFVDDHLPVVFQMNEIRDLLGSVSAGVDASDSEA